MADFEVEEVDRRTTYCDCCGHETQTIWGWVHKGPDTTAAYWISWTESHLADLGAFFDMVIGPWGDDTSANDRSAVSMVYRSGPDAGVMVIDAKRQEGIANFELKREDIIATPLADHVFALFDTIWLQDSRLFKTE
jgi:hypothetical protein